MKVLNRNTIAIYIATLFSYQMFIATSLLASMSAWFPDVSQNLIVLFFSGPTLVSCVLALALSAVMGRLNKKMLVVLGLSCIIAGGVIVVFAGGASFGVALAGVILCGAGFAFTSNATNTMLVEMNPLTASTTLAMNNAVGCLGSMILTVAAGFLARDGVWTRAYLLCFPAIITLVLFLALYRKDDKASQPAQQATAEAAPMQQAAAAPARSLGLFAMVVIVFLLANFGTAAWNTNYSTYVMFEKQIGTTVETGLMGTLMSLGGVLGGFVVAGFIIPRLKNRTVTVCLLLVSAPCLAAALGTNSKIVLYACCIIFMMFYTPAFGELAAAAGKLMPGGGVTFINAMVGLGSFAGPYLINFIGTFGDGTSTIKFWAGVAILVIGAIIAIPVMKKSSEKTIA